MPVVAFANLKGGVAKTSNAVAVAETLAARGSRVLVIDADHQCTASEMLLGESRMLQLDRTQQTLHDLLRDMLHPDFDGNFEAYVTPAKKQMLEFRDRLHVLPCSVRIDDFQSCVAKARKGTLSGNELSARWKARRVAFLRWLREHYDVTIIDCPPSLTRHVQFLLRLSDGIVIPSVPDHLSLRGALQFVDRLDKHRIHRPVLSTLWTLFRTQVEKHRVIVSLAAKRVSRPGQVPLPFKTVIPNAAALAFASDPDHEPDTLRKKYTPEFAAMYASLCDELTDRLGKGMRAH